MLVQKLQTETEQLQRQAAGHMEKQAKLTDQLAKLTASIETTEQRMKRATIARKVCRCNDAPFDFAAV